MPNFTPSYPHTHATHTHKPNTNYDSLEETQQSGHAPRSGPKVKNGRSDAEDGAPKGSDAGQSRRRRVRSCRGCPQALHEEFSSVLSCIGKRTKEGCDRGSEVETVHSG